MINTTQEIDSSFFVRWMTKEKMIEILSQLPNDVELHPNQVGNLSVVKNDTFIGYIDFSSEEYYPDNP